HPPRNTRAFGRGELIRHLIAAGPTETFDDQAQGRQFFPAYVINWSIIQVDGRTPFPMPDPFKTYVQDVRTYLQSA
ncbi:MAG: hypothetical protein AABY94_03135, partial [Nitrospirota bacterium]